MKTYENISPINYLKTYKENVKTRLGLYLFIVLKNSKISNTWIYFSWTLIC